MRVWAVPCHVSPIVSAILGTLETKCVCEYRGSALYNLEAYQKYAAHHCESVHIIFRPYRDYIRVLKL